MISGLDPRTAPIVVVADDDHDLLELACMELEAVGCELHRATDGVEALELIRTILPDLCVMDVHMPELQGDEVLRELRQGEDTRSIPVILMTATMDARGLLRDGPAPEVLLRKTHLNTLGQRARELVEPAGIGAGA